MPADREQILDPSFKQIEAEIAPLLNAYVDSITVPDSPDFPPPSQSFREWGQRAAREAAASRAGQPASRADAIVKPPPSPVRLHPAFESNIMSKKALQFTPFGSHQLEVDTKGKGVVTEWVDWKYPLESGDGVFYDAGSQCFFQAEKMVQRLNNGQILHPKIVTNNALITHILANRVNAHALRSTSISIAGDIFDAEHLAFFGASAKEKLTSGRFRAAVVYIGTSGIQFEGSSILFGYHAGSPEEEFKKLLFTCPAKDRVILASARKIGNAGGEVFDVLQLEGNAPIRLVTQAPEKDSPWCGRFEEARTAFLSDSVQSAIKSRNLTFRWTIVDPVTKKATTIPEENDHE